MYSYIVGRIKKTTPSSVVIENGGIGYLVNSPYPFSYSFDEEVLIYTYLYVREDIFCLYGFKTQDDLSLFIRLISVSGIGPKSALSMIAHGAASDIFNAIERSDLKYLTKFPGIGPKSAAQIILDLKNKLVNEDSTLDPKNDDLKDALVALGYKVTDINKVIKKLDPNLAVKEAIKEALVLLMK